MSRVVGIDLGGTSAKGIVVTGEGVTVGTDVEAFDDLQPLQFAEAVRRLIARLESIHGSADALGLSAPGLAASDGRSIAFMPGRLAGIEGLVWEEHLGRQSPVPVLNDAQAALLGEIWQGAAQGSRNAILLTLGTGVGGAAVVDGHLLRGAIGRAGHLGHICLDMTAPVDVTNLPGSLEHFVGNANIRERTGGQFETTHALVQAVVAGDPTAVGVWHQSIRALACGIASLINVLDPEVVIIGGGIARAGEVLFTPLRSELAPIEWCPGGRPVPLVPARLGEFAGALGAAYHALRSR